MADIDRGDELDLSTAGKEAADKAAEEAAKKSAGAGESEPTDKDKDKDKGKDGLSEGEETPEERAEREAEERKRNIRIPKSRFDEVQAKARAREKELLDQIDKLQNAKQTTDADKAVKAAKAKIEELQDRYEELITDGKKDEARKVRRQIDSLRDDLEEHRVSTKAAAVHAAALADMRFDMALSKFETQYPELNPDGEEYDQETVNEIAELIDSMVKAGKPRDEALKKAVKYVLGAPPDQRVADAAKTLAEKRAEEARKKAAEAAKRQPPNTNATGSDKGRSDDPGAIDVMKLTHEKFSKLDEETKARLRGDIA